MSGRGGGSESNFFGGPNVRLRNFGALKNSEPDICTNEILNFGKKRANLIHLSVHWCCDLCLNCVLSLLKVAFCVVTCSFQFQSGLNICARQSPEKPKKLTSVLQKSQWCFWCTLFIIYTCRCCWCIFIILFIVYQYCCPWYTVFIVYQRPRYWYTMFRVYPRRNRTTVSNILCL